MNKPESQPAAGVDANSRVAFFEALQIVTNKIHATNNIDEIMLELSQDICDLFNADRLTIYTLTDDKSAIVSKIKTGLNSFKDLRLPITDQSVAGYVALSRKIVNIRDVYDDRELVSHSPKLHFLKEVDRRTGYRTKQMLVAPVVDAKSEDLLGVVQLINNKAGTTFSPLAEQGVANLVQTLAVAFTQRKGGRLARTRYDGLIEQAVLSAAEFDLATRSARRKGIDLEEILISEFQVKPEAIGKALAAYFGVDYQPYKHDRVRPVDLLRNLKREYVEESHWLPIDETKEGVLVMALDPEKVKSSRIVNNIFPKSRIVYCVTTIREFRQTVDQYYGATIDSASVDDLLSDLGSEEEDLSISQDEISAAAENELVRLVNKVIVDAAQQNASDIHIEPRPGREKTLIRFRKDGSLVPYIEIPASYRSAIVARIKIMCDLDISERRKPQDGKIKFRKFGPLDIELRVATLPTAGGLEDVVMRILASGEPIPLEKLGLSDVNSERLSRVIDKPYGLFFVCGPTGSGKTTTLHSIMGTLNKPDTKIWTAEDPVEITQKGLRQVQVNRKAGLDFATVMRAFLRADPDIIMVGEMRDAETTGIGIEASLTGHLVLATLHTNSAPESVIRLLDMGMDPFNFADALLGVLAQRLAKRLCKCCKPYEAKDAEIDALLKEYAVELSNTTSFQKDREKALAAIKAEWQKKFGDGKGRITLKKAVGCSECNDSGYRGRVGLHELMLGTDDVKKLIQEKARVAELLAASLEDGMRTLKMDGIEKVLQGVTDMSQVRAVCIK